MPGAKAMPSTRRCRNTSRPSAPSRSSATVAAGRGVTGGLITCRTVVPGPGCLPGLAGQVRRLGRRGRRGWLRPLNILATPSAAGRSAAGSPCAASSWCSCRSRPRSVSVRPLGAASCRSYAAARSAGSAGSARLGAVGALGAFRRRRGQMFRWPHTPPAAARRRPGCRQPAPAPSCPGSASRGRQRIVGSRYGTGRGRRRQPLPPLGRRRTEFARRRARSTSGSARARSADRPRSGSAGSSARHRDHRARRVHGSAAVGRRVALGRGPAGAGPSRDEAGASSSEACGGRHRARSRAATDAEGLSACRTRRWAAPARAAGTDPRSSSRPARRSRRSAARVGRPGLVGRAPAAGRPWPSPSGGWPCLGRPESGSSWSGVEDGASGSPAAAAALAARSARVGAVRRLAERSRTATPASTLASALGSATGPSGGPISSARRIAAVVAGTAVLGREHLDRGEPPARSSASAQLVGEHVGGAPAPAVASTSTTGCGTGPGAAGRGQPPRQPHLAAGGHPLGDRQRRVETAAPARAAVDGSRPAPRTGASGRRRPPASASGATGRARRPALGQGRRAARAPWAPARRPGRRSAWR